MILASLLATAGGAASLVRVTVSEPPDAELLVGSRVAFAATSGIGEDRETLSIVPGCATVREVSRAGPQAVVGVEVEEADAAALAAIPTTAVVRVAICPS